MTGLRRPLVRLAAAALLASALAGCTTSDEGGLRGSFGDLGSSLGGSIGRNADTYGTNRRVDVYGATTAPSLPTIGAPGFGK